MGRRDRQPRAVLSVLAAVCVVGFPSRASAMHISEGILPYQWAGIWCVVALPFLWWGMRTIEERSRTMPEFKALVALVGAAVFIISCMPIPVPTAGTCSHPCGTGLGAILIGPGPTIVVASISLLLQALFMAHGGLTTLGADIVSMGIAGALSGYCAFVCLKRARVNVVICAFFAGLVSDWVTYAVTSVELALALHGQDSFWNLLVAIIVAFVPTQLPLGLFEGVLCAGAYKFVTSRRPDLLADGPLLAT